jgi:hypothetical protein
MINKFKMLIELRITNKNITDVEDITQQLFKNSVISFSDYSDVLTATMCFKALNSEEGEEILPDNVISIFEAKKAR